MNEKFMGVGLTNALALALFTMGVSIILKIIFTRYYVEGVSELARTA